jgi:aminopeptidase N
MVSYRVPAFQETPLVQWGPRPVGEWRPERAREYDLQHQVIRVRFDRARDAVVGSTTIRFAALATPLASATFDAVDMRITAVRGAGGESLRHDYDGRILTVALRSPLAPGARTTVAIEYETVRPKRGVHFVDRRKVVWTGGDPWDTRHWVPTYDHPNDKSTWEIHVTTAAGERALSNGRLIASRPVAGGTEWHWSMTRPAPTRLMSIVTGNFIVLQDVWRAIPIGYWTYSDSVEAAWRGFAATPRMMDLFTRRTGVLYPWEKYDQAVVPDHPAGGTENATGTTHADDRVLDPSSSSAHADAEAPVAHGLAHQWFGAYVTARDWPDLWLDEGLATFFEAVWAEEAHGGDAGALARVGAHERAILADRANRRPLVEGRWDADPAELLATGHVASRGAAVLQMLRHSMGDSIFWAGVRGYTRTHALGVAVTADFRREMERASGRDLGAFFDQWVHGAGFPTFRVAYAYDSLSRGLGISALQMQPRDSLTGFFDADVEVEVLTERGTVRDTMRVRGEHAAISMSLPAAPLSIRWDRGGWVLDIADFPRPTVMLAHQLSHDGDVLGRIEAADLLGARRDEPKAVDALVGSLSRDSASVVRAAAARALATLGDTSVIPALEARRAVEAESRVLTAIVGALSALRAR